MKKACLLLLLAWLVSLTAHAQSLGYVPAQALNQAGIYTDLGTAGTAITTANTDDANSAAQAIGFSFVFGGTTYTQFILNTNGFIKLGTMAPATAAAFQPYAQLGAGGPVDDASLTDLVLPFNTDLTSAASAAAEYRVATTGTAPNRVCTVQWKNVADKPRPTTNTNAALVPAQLASFSFQLKLYEADRRIEFVYGPAVASTAASTYSSATVGLKGQSNAASSGQLVLAQKNSGQDWAATVFVDVPYTATVGHNLRNTYLPDAGRTYSFSIPVPNDAAVAEIHALGTALVPGAPLSIDVVVRNAGTAAFAGAAVTLTIAGANTVAALTQPTGTLGVGSSTVVTFSGISLAVAGANTITASLPADGNAANNVLTQALTTSASAISYVVGPANADGFGFNAVTTTSTGAFAARFSLSAARTVTSVQAFLTNYPAAGTQASTVGQTVYGVVLNATTGAVLARSPDFVVTSAAINTNYSFALTTPVTLPAGDYLAGLATVVQANALPYYAMGAQREVPTRTNLFYSIDDLQSSPTPTAYPASTGLRFMLGVTTSAPLAATAAAAPLAFSAYPNPSATGDFTLELGGRPATGSQPVEVTDALGRRVYAGTAPVGARSPLPLRGLAPGCYLLRVGGGAARRLSIVSQ